MTRTEVLLLLGEPDVRGADDQWFSYTSYVGLGGVTWGDVPLVSTAGTERYLLRRFVVQFDNSGVISDVQSQQQTCVVGPHVTCSYVPY
jgi:hypothetical protein